MKKIKIQHWQIIDIGLILYDILFTFLSYFLALWVRYDFRFTKIADKYLVVAKSSLIYVVIFFIFISFILNLYNSIWRFASINELVRGFVSSVLTLLFNVIVTKLFFRTMPLSYYVVGVILHFLFCTGIRFTYRIYLGFVKRLNSKNSKINIMVIGAGEAGQMIIKDIYNNNSNKEKKESVVCIIDDNPNKWGRYVGQVKVVGGRNKIVENVKKYEINRIVIAIPSAGKKEINEIMGIVSNTGCDIKIVPMLSRFTKEEIKSSKLKNVEISDLLGRSEIKTDLKEVFSNITDKVVLVTGAGGSIGSELSRQIAANHPKELILFDIYENSTYDVELELIEKYPGMKLRTLIGSVRDNKKVNEIFDTYHPDLVYHAAAHKHVPLMEDSPNEAIKNNCFGTLNLACAAISHNTKKFTLISTDKAVNPTNIMSASKRICEMIIQTFNKCIENGDTNKLVELYKSLYGEELVLPDKVLTSFGAVRFGNVLGSNGSVVPIFKKQIEKGGPITVTDPNITRYFMTIPEAVSLVLQSSIYAKGGEIFVLDMGEPVKIVDLARNLIKLSGKTEDEIKIVFTGLRPGEKLYEERLMDEEGLQKTANDSISIGKPLEIDVDEFLNSLTGLYKMAYSNIENIEEEVSNIVKTYKPQK